eukprot:6495590-Pyramimonas_sp.AAC.1
MLKPQTITHGGCSEATRTRHTRRSPCIVPVEARKGNSAIYKFYQGIQAEVYDERKEPVQRIPMTKTQLGIFAWGAE